VGLVDLGRHTGLSAAMLSKVERGRLFPALPTLLRIALVFSVGLGYFFSEDQKHRTLAIVRRAERKRFPERPDGRDISFVFESLDFAALERQMSAYYAEFQVLAAGKARMHHHAKVEFLTVLRGKLEMRIGNEEHILEAGDSIYFDASLPHSYRPSESKDVRGDRGDFGAVRRKCDLTFRTGSARMSGRDWVGRMEDFFLLDDGRSAAY
jgi:mannose-6-phosphate isomerase-like protein (cupin superfamily)